MAADDLRGARLLHREREDSVLFPVFARNTQLPSYMRAVHYEDCREGDEALLRRARLGRAAEVYAYDEPARIVAAARFRA